MKQQLRIVMLSLGFAIIGLGTALAEDSSQDGGELTCSNPISNKDTGESLYSRYGEGAGLNTFQDRNYLNFIDVALFSFTDAALSVKLQDNDFVKNVVAVELWPGVTAWSVKGVKVGMSIEQVTAINGAPFKLAMADRELVANADFSNGHLGRIEGGCRLKMALRIPDDVKIPQSIEHGEVSSDDPELVKARPVVAEIFLLWPRK